MGSVKYDFTGETVIITGGASGIGRAVARRFGASGASVIIADLRKEPSNDSSLPTHEVIQNNGGEAVFVKTDVSDSDDVASVVEAARDFGGVDIMVNNAGIYRGSPLVELDDETVNTLYGVNVGGVVAGCRAAARDMLERGIEGNIINTASISSEYAQLGHMAYDATKGAIRMATRVAALELAQTGIRVNGVAPGEVSTTIIADEEDEIGGETTYYDLPDLDKDIPMGRIADPSEIAGAYLYLASDDASYVTGQLLYVDGGYQVF